VQQSTELANSPNKTKAPKSALSKEVEKDDSVHVVLSGSNGVILDVDSRESNLLNQKVDETTLIVHAVTSMDDAIDTSRE